VCDGSYKDTFGTAAWVLLEEESGAFITGCALCPGAARDRSSYRSELAGLYSVLTVTRKLCKYFDIQEGGISIGCDRLLALDTSLYKEPVSGADVSNYDLVAAIYATRKRLPIIVWPHFVKGHQDKMMEPLDTWAQLNIQMDAMAKQHMQVAISAPRHYSIEGEPWQLWVRDYKLTHSITPNIYALMHDEEGASYWESKREVKEGATSLIDWENIGTAMKGVTRSCRVFISKHTSGMCGVGKFMKRWRQWNIDQYP